ncbi:RING finger domain-containing protein [Apiospora arundinis]
MEPRDDDVPLPPYSETDIYSNASARSPTAPRSGSNANADDASIAASSSHSNIIYTPPETPRESHYNFSGGDDLATSSSAQAYFESRPVTSSPSAGLEVVHILAYQENATPADFPYPGWATSHQTTEQDWHTFVNYLIPDYSLSVNAQVNQIKPSVDDAPRRRSFDETLSTVIEWNEGFFGPRGVAIRLDPPSSSPRVPGGWNRSFDSANAAQHSPQERSLPQQQQAGAAPGGFGGLFGSSRFNMEANGNGLRFGPISINGDRVSIGRSFHADSNGVRWGDQAANDQTRAPTLGHRGGFGDSTEGFDHGHSPDTGFGRGRGRGRGRGHQHGGRRGRSSSASSSSSDDSVSSSDSDSSLGSLPDWDDLKDSQIPVVKQSVSQWVQNSGHPVSKAEFKRVKAEIKAAKSSKSAKGTVDAAQKDEVKRLLAQWKDVKKSQKAVRKLARKEKKAEKKNKKKERRARRNAERSEHRRDRRDRRRSERECRRGGAHPTPPGAAGTSGPGGFGMPGPLHHHGLPHHGPPPHGPGAFGFGPGRAGGPGFFSGMGLFGGPVGTRGSGGRGSWGPTHHDEPNVPHGDEKAREASEEAEAARKTAAEQSRKAQEEAEISRQDALERAQQARNQAESSRQAALVNAQEARDRAQQSRDAGLRSAQASRDAALANAQEARDRAQSSRDAALQNAHASRDAALANAQQARERAQQSRDNALANAQASRERALADANASRDAALANAQASRDRGLNQAREAVQAARQRAQAEQEAARGYGEGAGGWSSLGRAFDARQNAREWVRTARETAMRHAWSTTSGAQAHADAAREQARHTAATAGGTRGAAAPVPVADDSRLASGGGQETGVASQNNSCSVEKKYETLGTLESELEAKMNDLCRLEQTIEAEGVAAAQAGNGDSKTQSPAQQEYERLGTDIDEMSRRIEALRLEADEEFARELAETEAVGTRA